jgi:basic amino acid/polyamine antiporter, APA family
MGGVRYTDRMDDVANDASGQVRDDGSTDAGTLGLWDAVSIVIGIVVGTTIFRSSPTIFANSSGPLAALGAWALGGVLSLIGAMCYAELATTYPRSGGDYEYLTRAFGPWAGFLFGWAQLTAVFAANLGIMAYAFGDYGAELLGLDPRVASVWLAVAAILAMTLLNAWTVHAGALTQNALTAAKVVGLAAIILAGAKLATTASDASLTPHVEQSGESTASFGLAMVFVLYAYGGWNDAAFVAAEVRNRSRNLPLALVGGVAAITVIYLAVNMSYLALGFDGARRSVTPAASLLEAAAGPIGAKVVSGLVMISALGAMNGMILSRSRIFAAMGEDHRVFAWLGGWHAGRGVPRASLAAQAAVTLVVVLLVGTGHGRGALDKALRSIGSAGVPWEQFSGGFDLLLTASAPVFWALFLGTGVAMMVLRQREPNRERPFQAPLYPLAPLVFCGMCLFMLYRSIAFAQWLAVAGAAPVGLGLLLYALTRKR